MGDQSAPAAVLPGARATRAHVASGSPARATILQIAQISELMLKACGDCPWLLLTPECLKSGACLNGRRPGQPPVDKQHSSSGVAGSQPAPSTHRAATPKIPRPSLTSTRRASMLAAGARADAGSGESGADERAAVPPSRSRSRAAGGRNAQTRARGAGRRPAFPRLGVGPASCGNAPPMHETPQPWGKKGPQNILNSYGSLGSPLRRALEEWPFRAPMPPLFTVLHGPERKARKWLGLPRG